MLNLSDEDLVDILEGSSEIFQFKLNPEEIQKVIQDYHSIILSIQNWLGYKSIGIDFRCAAFEVAIHRNTHVEDFLQKMRFAYDATNVFGIYDTDAKFKALEAEDEVSHYEDINRILSLSKITPYNIRLLCEFWYNQVVSST